jgi:hypothetical protein
LKKCDDWDGFLNYNGGGHFEQEENVVVHIAARGFEIIFSRFKHRESPVFLAVF